MNAQQLKMLVTLVLCSVLAIFLGYMLGGGRYYLVFLLGYTALVVFLLVAPGGYAPLVALGLGCPFSTPSPFVYGFPFVGTILGICVLKYMVRQWIGRRRHQVPKLSVPAGFGLFFGWVLIRYCIDPVLPNAIGFGASVTGFRSYLNYIICFALVVFLSASCRRREDVVALIRWIGIFALCFTLLLMPLVLTKSMAVAQQLSSLGMFVTTFDNGWLRFVVLPGFGCTLISLGLFPGLTGWSRVYRRIMIGIGVLAVIMGGNRGSFIIAFILLLVIAWVRRRLLGFSLVATTLVLCLVAFRYVGDRFDFEHGVGFFRILSLTSQRVARQTNADETMTWRQQRWKRAIEDIRNRPWIGYGYGGLENAFVYGTSAQFEMAMVDIDVANGTLHNGFIASARAFGIPGLLLFVIAYVGRIVFNAKRTVRFRVSDPVVSDLHCFVFAYLVAMGVAIFVGADLNSPVIWFYLALGDLVAEFKKGEAVTAGALGEQETELTLMPRPAVS